MSKEKPTVVIIDYGMGNLFSIERVINYLGGAEVISWESSVISSAERLILPGVGAFGDGMENLRKRGLVEPVKEFVQSGKPILGICLGMQLLMSESEEFGFHGGLDLVQGKVKRLLDEPYSQSQFHKIPHVGWNSLHLPLSAENSGHLWDKTILQNISEGAFVYFVHSYVAIPDSASDILAETVYGNNRFCSVLQKNNLFGCQFHPEVSGEVGLQILREFLLN